MSIFEKAAQLKLRFTTSQGSINTEDLWDLPLKSASKVSLDSLAKGISRQIKSEDEESFVDEKSVTNTILELKLDILKRVIEVRKEENSAKASAVTNKAQRDKLLRIIASKEDSDLEGKSIEELNVLLKATG